MFEFLALLGIAASTAATVHLLLGYRNAAAAVAWLFGFWLFPFVGVALYFVFASRRAPRSVRKTRARANALRRRDTGPGAGPSAEPGADSGADPSERAIGLARLSDRVAAFPLSEGNRVELFETNDEAFDAILDAIRGAEREVGVGTFILRDDRLGRELAEALGERASAGVTVRLVYDQIGSASLAGTFVDGLRQAGVDAVGFLPPSVIKRRFQPNFRNHRKIVVVDGRVAFTGGLNWGDEYSESRSAGRVLHDLEVRIEGPAVADLRRVFLEDWCLAADAELPEELEPSAADGDTSLRVVPQGPDEERDRLVSLLAGAIVGAEREIFLATPYFVPGDDMRGALRLAALRGVKVSLLIAAKSDSVLVDFASRRHFDPLLEAGVEIRLHTEGMLHAKAVVVDGVWSTLGSANYDQRSFHANYELNVEVVGGAFASALAGHFATWRTESAAIDPVEHARRSAWRRVLENAANLFEPLL